MKNKLGATASGARLFIQSQIDGTKLIEVCGVYHTIDATNAAIEARGLVLGVADEIKRDDDSIGILACMNDTGRDSVRLFLSLTGHVSEMEKSAEAARRGERIAYLLDLPKKRNGRYDTMAGDKTPEGLYWTLARFFSERELPV